MKRGRSDAKIAIGLNQQKIDMLQRNVKNPNILTKHPRDLGRES